MTSSGRTASASIRRPGAGVEIDRVQLVRLRHERQLSRAQLAKAMTGGDYKITPDAIAKIENGHRRPKTPTLARLCVALDCNAADLLPHDNSQPQLTDAERAQLVSLISGSPRPRGNGQLPAASREPGKASPEPVLVRCPNGCALGGHEPGCPGAT